MTTDRPNVQYDHNVLLHIDLDYTASVLEDWQLGEDAIAQIHRSVATILDSGQIDELISGVIMDAAQNWLDAKGTLNSDEDSNERGLDSAN